ncbi:MAG: hypothetical protein HKN73_18700 [Gemmatimonadetes bacterium]|nr:hypothetical protein [Gemmatimonadota bacterium]
MSRPRSGGTSGPYVLGLVLVLSVGCTAGPPLVEAPPGEPLPGLDGAQLDAFRSGEAAFNRPFSEAEGLGPLYNQDRCSSCHDLPTSGGHGAEPVSKATRHTDAEGCSLLTEVGGDLFQQIVSDAGRAQGLTPEAIPSTATASADIVPPPLYGLGLVDAVLDEAILARADPVDSDEDGISGRALVDAEGRVGRFGWKAQHSTLAGFIEEATRLEMGVTTPAHPSEERPGGEAMPAGADPAPDPEVDEAFLRSLEAYIRYLAPPPRSDPGDPDAADDIAEGERIFSFTGCDVCHVPTMVTPESEHPAMDRKVFRIYSDLLIHDLGPDLADTCTPQASPSEWRTAPLVGLGLRQVYLHDGRAQTISTAIELHGGEAAQAREIFRSLNPQSREQLLAYLRSL